MKRIKVVLLALLISLNTGITSGCWNYREVDTMAIVAGVTVDKGIDGKYMITAEIVKISGGMEIKTTSEIISMEGESMIDAVRNEIALSGKRLYWSHAKIIIISEEIAREGIAGVIDWYLRDSETRADVHLLISRGNSANEIFKGKTIIEEIKSYELAEMLDNQKSLSKAPRIEMWEFSNRLSQEGFSAVAPVINLKEVNGKKNLRIEGTAIFSSDKVIGFLDGQETQAMLFVQNQVMGGVLPSKVIVDETSATLEIFKSKTKVEPVIDGNTIQINVNIDITTAIDELDGPADLISEEGRKKLEQRTEDMLKKSISELIRKIQTDYNADIFGFGARLREDRPVVWKRIGNKWKEEFKNLKVSVDINVNIKKSAMLSKPLEVGD
jgi:spore germination protein KC